jgi:hypothetical protein
MGAFPGVWRDGHARDFRVQRNHGNAGACYVSCIPDPGEREAEHGDDDSSAGRVGFDTDCHHASDVEHARHIAEPSRGVAQRRSE